MENTVFLHFKDVALLIRSEEYAVILQCVFLLGFLVIFSVGFDQLDYEVS